MINTLVVRNINMLSFIILLGTFNELFHSNLKSNAPLFILKIQSLLKLFFAVKQGYTGLKKICIRRY